MVKFERSKAAKYPEKEEERNLNGKHLHGIRKKNLCRFTDEFESTLMYTTAF